jgi:phage shock protein A
MKSKIDGAEARNAASRELMDGDSVDDKFAKMERDEEIDALLAGLKGQHAAR